MTVSLTTLIASVRQRCDMVNSTFVSDAEMTAYINNSGYELYEEIVSRFEDYFTTYVTFTVAAGADGYDLSTLGVNVFKLRGVEKSLSGSSSANDWVNVAKFDWNSRNVGNNVSNQRLATVGYDWVGARLKLVPTSQAPGVYQIWYVPDYTPLVSGSDVLSSELTRWSEYIIVDCAIKCLQKEESDPAVFIMQKEQLKARINATAANRDAQGQEKVGDVTSGYCDIQYPFNR